MIGDVPKTVTQKKAPSSLFRRMRDQDAASTMIPKVLDGASPAAVAAKAKTLFRREPKPGFLAAAKPQPGNLRKGRMMRKEADRPGYVEQLPQVTSPGTILFSALVG